MPQTKLSRSSESTCSPKAQVLANPCSAATNWLRVSPSWRLRLLKRNRSISVDGAGLKCECSAVNSSLSVLSYDGRLETVEEETEDAAPVASVTICPGIVREGAEMTGHPPESETTHNRFKSAKTDIRAAMPLGV
ncbi:hypothetical protein HPB50_010418 [Hyalomma asiaticum]|uniref:Uncharacterized protein n=1 Tax=Hyalomma asiaticum TaxID=266040 RepID=A0ACB7SDQ9_HYAAI|nr:hypothetical protein HPB50_010418 [Hyalomma asiaticum]